jgi:hypothetical protein
VTVWNDEWTERCSASRNVFWALPVCMSQILILMNPVSEFNTRELEKNILTKSELRLLIQFRIAC